MTIFYYCILCIKPSKPIVPGPAEQVQVSLSPEGLPAALHWNDSESLQMNILVVLQAGLLRECLPAAGAGVGLGPAVHHYVGVEVGRATEGLVTGWTEDLPAHRVHQYMVLNSWRYRSVLKPEEAQARRLLRKTRHTLCSLSPL